MRGYLMNQQQFNKRMDYLSRDIIENKIEIDPKIAKLTHFFEVIIESVLDKAFLDKNSGTVTINRVDEKALIANWIKQVLESRS